LRHISTLNPEEPKESPQRRRGLRESRKARKPEGQKAGKPEGRKAGKAGKAGKLKDEKVRI